jgi:hypothetical protein
MDSSMRLAGEISLRPLAAGSDDEPRSEVVIDSRPTGSIVSGCVLEAAVDCAAGWLLFVTSDTPYEEMLTIHLLDRGGRPLDSAHVGGPYTTGAFTSLRLDPPSTVHFRFIDNADWSVRVLPAPRRALPWWPDARGVWRGSRLTRHFEVRRQPR